MPLFKKNQRYKVSRKSDFIQLVRLLDGSQMECNLSADSLPSDCLENVLQRLEVREVALFGMKYFTRTGQMRWADFDTPLKRQLEKYASSQVLYIGVFYYIDRAYALQDEATRYQYYVQLKSDVLNSRVYCTLEQAILLAGYALQAEYQNYDEARQSEQYIKDIERLDRTLLPRNLMAEYDSTSALADIAQHIVSSHMTLSGMSTSQSEIAYIHLAQQMDGCGVEYANAMTVDGEEIYLGSSSSGVTVRRHDGHVTQQFNWPQITDLSATKKSLLISVANKKLSTKLILEDIDTAKYVQRVFQLQQEFFHDNYSHLLYSDEALTAQQENSEPLLSPARHATQLSNLSNTVLYDTTRTNRENAVDVIEEEPSLAGTSVRDIPETVNGLEEDISTRATPDILDSQYESDYATMKFKKDPKPISERPRAMTASLYAGSSQTPMLDQLHKNDLLHRSMTALQEYRDSFEQLQQQQEQRVPPTPADQFLSQGQPRNALLNQYTGSADHLNTPSTHNISGVLSRSMHALELSSHQQSGLPSYRPSPDYDKVMRERSMHAHAYMPEAYYQQQTVRELQNGGLPPDPRFVQHAMSSTSQPDISTADTKEPLYANIIQQYTHIQNNSAESGGGAVDRDQQPTPYQNHHYVSPQQHYEQQHYEQQHYEQQHYEQQRQHYEQQQQHYEQQPHKIEYPNPYYSYGGADHLQEPHHLLVYSHQTRGASTEPSPPLYPRINSTPDIIQANPGRQAPDITNLNNSVIAYVSGSPDVISRRRHLIEPTHPVPQGIYRSADNIARVSAGEDRLSINSQRSSRSSGGREELPARGTRLGSNMSNNGAVASLQPAQSHRPSLDERVTGLEEKLNTDGIAAEYESLLKKRQPADCRVALRPENDARNRFPNVLPYEDTRVRLIATSTNPHGYINASHVEMNVGKEKLTYIATQNPFVDTVEDFWQMIWVYNVSIITMVTELEERGTQKCPRYWPSAAGHQNAVAVNDLKIVLKHSASAPNFTTSCLRVLKTSTKEQRTIWHIQHTDWHQTGCPKDVHGFLALLDELNSVRLHIQTSKQNASPRMLVHCSTGVGRSGVVILSDVMRKCLENNEKISVASTLKELRQQRMYMVQTLAQYKFVHEVLVHYLKGVRLI